MPRQTSMSARSRVIWSDGLFLQPQHFQQQERYFERYIEAKKLADECRHRLDALLGAIDVLLTPAAFGEAPVGMPAFAGVPLYQIWTTLHVPAVTIPVFKGPAGMPIGAQLIGPFGMDHKTLVHAEWVRRALT